MTKWMFLPAVAVLCGACSSSELATPGSSDRCPWPSPAANIVLEAESSGGIAGATESCRILSDGMALRSSGAGGGSRQMSQAEVDVLMDALRASDVESEGAGCYLADEPASDDVTSRVLVRLQNGSVLQVTYDGSGSPPEAVTQAFDLIRNACAQIPLTAR